jgi:hypothetical protein
MKYFLAGQLREDTIDMMKLHFLTWQHNAEGNNVVFVHQTAEKPTSAVIRCHQHNSQRGKKTAEKYY